MLSFELLIKLDFDLQLLPIHAIRFNQVTFHQNMYWFLDFAMLYSCKEVYSGYFS